MQLKLLDFSVRNYRSLLNVKLKMESDFPITICGENNVGKTNFLRALNLYFNHLDQDLFSAKRDIPYHIFDGARGGGAKTALTGTFLNLQTGDKFKLKITFREGKEEDYELNGTKVSWEKADETLDKFRFIYIKSNNINVPEVINEILEDDVLLPLDKQRSRQSEPLKVLKEFIQKSQRATSGIERKINKYFDELTDFDGTLKNGKIKIKFAEFDLLRDAVKNMTQITIDDGNNLSIENKGSGAQRAVLLSIMQFISKNSKRKVIWGLDEPEAFLQPKLQRKMYATITSLVQEQLQPIVITTHSQHFIDLKNLSHTHLFGAEITPKTYARKKDKKYFQIDTKPIATESPVSKAMAIREHLGIESNDGWRVLPENLIVEGEEDQKYLQLLMEMNNIVPPNILWAGGASKIKGYLQFFNEFAKDLTYKPRFTCIFDEDKDGRSAKDSLSVKTYPNIDVVIANLPYPTMQNAKGFEWEIEDFLPHELVFKAINKILRNRGYKIINKKCRDDRINTANRKTQILRYAEVVCRQINPNKEPIVLDNEGRKKEICQTICQIYRDNHLEYGLVKSQKNFLKLVSKSN